MLALFFGAAALVVAVVEVIRARARGRSVRWLIVMVAVLTGGALLWLWWTHLRFPLVQPVGQPQLPSGDPARQCAQRLRMYAQGVADAVLDVAAYVEPLPLPFLSP